MLQLLEILFGCDHAQLTFPITRRRRAGAAKPETYVVCLDCGGELAYDWQEMKIRVPSQSANPIASLEPADM
jgi:hypothetical protein